MSIASRSNQYGKIFDHWHIREFLGQGSGGKSAVFKMIHSESSGVSSALKVINLIEEQGAYEELPEYRRAEYDLAARDCSRGAEREVLLMNDLQGNTNIVDYLDHTFVDWVDENGFGRDMLIRMELLKDLRGEVRQGRQFAEEEILKVGRDICAALVLCHGKNILHRDIKPENIFINKDGNYKLGDFGVSRILGADPRAMASTSIGTPAYAAPEQFTGAHDKRIDIYSLGLVLYELANGNMLPFAGSTYARQEEIARRMAGEPLPMLERVSEHLDWVIRKACAYKPEMRFQSAQEFLDELNRVGSGGYVAASAPNYGAQRQSQPDLQATVPLYQNVYSSYGSQQQNQLGPQPTAPLTMTPPRNMGYGGQPVPYESQAPAKKSGGSKVVVAVLMILLVVALAACVGLGVYFLNQDGEKTEKPGDSPVSQTEPPTNPTTEPTTQPVETEPETEPTRVEYPYGSLEYYAEHCGEMVFGIEYFRGFTEWECILAKNAPYAQIGYDFSDERVQSYFEQFEWYEPTVKPSELRGDMLNSCHNSNIYAVDCYQDMMGYQK